MNVWKVFSFWVFLVRIFPHLDRNLLCNSPYSVQMLGNTDQKNCKYKQFRQCILNVYVICTFSYDNIYNLRLKTFAWNHLSEVLNLHFIVAKCSEILALNDISLYSLKIRDACYPYVSATFIEVERDGLRK